MPLDNHLAERCSLLHPAAKSTIMLRYLQLPLRYAAAFGILTGLFVGPNSVAASACIGNDTRYLLEKEARRGDTAAMLYLGEKLLQPGCSTAQRHSGLVWMERAAALEDPDALYALGMLIMAHTDPDEIALDGVAYLERAAEANHVNAAAFLGAYLLSVSTSQELREEGFFWLGKAASQGSVVAALTAHQVFADGLHGVPRDKCTAALWHEAAFLVQNPTEVYKGPVSPVCAQ